MDHLCFCVLYFSCLCICSLLPCCHLLGKAALLALVGDVYLSFVTFPCGILGQVWYLIVSFPDLCLLSYFGVQQKEQVDLYAHRRLRSAFACGQSGQRL